MKLNKDSNYNIFGRRLETASTPFAIIQIGVISNSKEWWKKMHLPLKILFNIGNHQKDQCLLLFIKPILLVVLTITMDIKGTGGHKFGVESEARDFSLLS